MAGLVRVEVPDVDERSVDEDEDAHHAARVEQQLVHLLRLRHRLIEKDVVQQMARDLRHQERHRELDDAADDGQKQVLRIGPNVP